ncbi:MAG: hypothetical protein ABJA94_07330 [Rhodoglobus sp.]
MNRVNAQGIIVTARLVGVHPDGDSAVELEFLVSLPTGIQIPVACTVTLQRRQRPYARVGSTVSVDLDPQLPQSLRIAWAKAA